MNSKYKDIFSDDYSKFKTEDQLVDANWYQYSGSSVFIKKLNINIMISRIAYSIIGVKNYPITSFLSVQLFDNNWNELNYFPNNIIKDKFPTILNIPFYYHTNKGAKYFGPEDPRVILKPNFINNNIDEEPVIIFNMDLGDEIDNIRAMHAYLPFQKHLIHFQIIGETVKKKEKNWKPFIDEKDYLDNDHLIEIKYQIGVNSKFGYINFIYNISPLTILKCNLDNGLCLKTYQELADINKNTNENNEISVMRGGTNLFPIKGLLREKFNNNLQEILKNKFERKDIWIGFAKTHLKNCGCGERIYRPHLFLFSKENSENKKYKIELISSSVDFNIEVLSWDEELPNDQACFSKFSVLMPNSVAYWDLVDNQYTEEDYMGITLSESDSNVIVIHVRGMLKYLLNSLNKEETIYIDKKLENDQDKGKKNEKKNNLLVEIESRKMVECVIEKAKRYCEEYGFSHKKIENLD
ncbi:glycosyltransferase family 91 protein [Ascoidea rubescens DSM 1968]|uniref:Glycosyltransferase family 91 protein n=1 Tax=Ascoidea rubescens DSM 1968 TaxID=1344418 RepID=A0A1D2VQ86_9ASCO|nr:glycosyltransferase family 91 protein [Ascoidea rubescens DSM 1968]ODV63768.1 glycosyltransferase family 91 protein [Ascoidea rubescens DSM 1968]